jgi:hypothetical protein
MFKSQNDHSAKTGSGQTHGKIEREKEAAFSSAGGARASRGVRAAAVDRVPEHHTANRDRGAVSGVRKTYLFVCAILYQK